MLPIQLQHASGVRMPGAIRRADIVADGTKWFVDWFPKLFDLSGNHLYPDSHWNFPKILGDAAHHQTCEAYVIEASGKIQGYTILDSEYTLSNGQPGIYIYFVSSAPWNRQNNLTGGKVYNRIGLLLIGLALALSISKQYPAVVELHSLPTAYSFYTKAGFFHTGNVKGNLPEMRIEGSKANYILNFFIDATK